ncbi:exonuclease family protein [Apiospora arundinis]
MDEAQGADDDGDPSTYSEHHNTIPREKFQDGYFLEFAEKIWMPGPTTPQNFLMIEQLSSMEISVTKLLLMFIQPEHLIQSLGHLYQVVEWLKSEQDWQIDNFRRKFEQDIQPAPEFQGLLDPNQVHLAQDFQILNSLQLSLRVWLMMGVGDAAGIQAAGEPLYPCPDRSFVDNIIDQPQYSPVQVDRGESFPGYFTLRDMEYMGNFEVRFTDDLLNHLQMRRFRDSSFRPSVYIFQHAAVLEWLAIYGPNPGYRELAKETLMTFTLLIPQNEDCHAWFRRARNRAKRSSLRDKHRTMLRYLANLITSNKDESPVDEALAGSQFLPLDKYQFTIYRSRLLLLEKEFASASAWSLRAWWYDRRDGRNWVTFWAQVLGAILAVVSFVAAAIALIVSAELAVQANEYARRANDLASLANAYASNASTTAVAANTTEAVAATTTFTSLILGVTTNYVSSIVNQNNIQNGDCRSLSSAQRLAVENMAGFFPTSTAAPQPTAGARIASLTSAVPGSSDADTVRATGTVPGVSS